MASEVKADLQRKTFTKWLNHHLRKKNVEVKELFSDLRDGRLLLDLVEVFTGKRLTRETGRMRLHRVANLNRALGQLRKDGVHLVNVDAEDVMDGNEKLTLALIWALIRRYQMSAGEGGAEQEGKAGLLQWCQERLTAYPGIKVGKINTRMLCIS